MTDCFDRNKFKEILVIIDSSKFNYSDKIGEFKYIDIRDSVNNIRNNTISKIDAKKNLSTLNKIKNAEIISYKNHTPKHKELLNLFNDLIDIILTDKTLESESQENKNENEKVESRKKNMKMKMMIIKMKMKMKMIIMNVKMNMKMKMMKQ